MTLILFHVKHLFADLHVDTLSERQNQIEKENIRKHAYYSNTSKLTNTTRNNLLPSIKRIINVSTAFERIE